jgi:predicted HicB family RNase H-like nuclease
MAYRPANTEDQVQIQIRLPRTLRERLHQEARRRAISVNFLAERAIANAIDQWEKEKVSP